MMNYKIIYFSRTGNSKRIAKKIACKLMCDLIQLHDNVNWEGFGGYIKFIYYRLCNKTVNISLSRPINEYDELVVITPLWDSKPVPAVIEFLKAVPIIKVHLVTDAAVSILKNTDGYASVSSITAKSGNENMVIHSLVEMLK